MYVARYSTWHTDMVAIQCAEIRVYSNMTWYYIFFHKSCTHMTNFLYVVLCNGQTIMKNSIMKATTIWILTVRGVDACWRNRSADRRICKDTASRRGV